MAKSFPQDVQWSLQPSGPFDSFEAGAIEGRIYRNTGHIEVAGPDLAGNPKTNLVHFAPPAIQTDQGSLSISEVTSSITIPEGLQLKQKLGASEITARLTSSHEGVIRYEVVHWGSTTPLSTAIASPSDSNEHFYGFGERFGSFDQAGKSVRILTFDEPGNKKDHSYKVSPWFISTRGYGLHLDSSAESIFDMRAAAHDRYVITNRFPGLRFNIVYGPKLTDVLTRYTGYTGRPPLPPPWTFGPWISSDIWRSGGEVRYVVTQFRDRGLPASAFVFDSPWETAYNDFKFNMTQFGQDATIDGKHFDGFASMEEMMTFLQNNGLKVICWMAPFVNTSSNNETVPGQDLGKASNYDAAASEGFFVKASSNGPPLVVPWWKGRGSPVDFTNPDGRRWLTDQLKTLLAQSRVTTASGNNEPAIGGFKTDDGESGNGPNTYIPIDAHYFDGRTGVEMRNGYCVEYHRTAWNVLGNDGIIFARSGFVGSHTFPGSWAGDNEPNFGENGLPSVIVAGQSAAMSGYSIWGHDVGGYQDTNFSVSRPNLFMRWAQFGCFSPIMQMHRQVASEMQYPWRYGAAALDNFRFFAQLHITLFPYLYTYALQASTTGLPIIRPLVLMDQSDPNTFGVRHVYHFGDEFLVAPMIEPESSSRRLYLPAGSWIDFWTNDRHAGAQTTTWTNTDQTRFPLFVREGAIVPMLLEDAQSLCTADYVNNPSLKTAGSGLRFRVYPSGTSRFSLFDGTVVECQSAPPKTVISLSSKARAVAFDILADSPDAITRNGVAIPQFATEAEFNAADVGWRADSLTRQVSIKFSHQGGDTTIRL
jgi:alpha-D-xyloside xylohydrolase